MAALAAVVAKVEGMMMEEVALHLELIAGWWPQHCVAEIRDAGMVELKFVGDSEMVCEAGHSQA